MESLRAGVFCPEGKGSAEMMGGISQLSPPRLGEDLPQLYPASMTLHLCSPTFLQIRASGSGLESLQAA